MEPKTLRTSVVDTIRQAILERILLPGEQVNQAQIAEQLGISRGPLREALGQLEEEGLIRNIPYKGTFVTEITPTYIDELFSIRRVLELFALERFMQYAGPDILGLLRRTVADMYTAATANDLDQLDQLDLQFHYLLCRGARHRLLLQLWKAIETGVRRCQALGHRNYGDLRDVIGTHPHILTAIEQGRSDEARALLDAHIREAGEQIGGAWATS